MSSNRTTRNWNFLAGVGAASVGLLIVPQGIEIGKFVDLLLKGVLLLIVPQGIEIHHGHSDPGLGGETSNSTTRNWNEKISIQLKKELNF